VKSNAPVTGDGREVEVGHGDAGIVARGRRRAEEWVEMRLADVAGRWMSGREILGGREKEQGLSNV
jgi:hypothetical protein